MRGKEEMICIWIHHTATILGWLTALSGLFDRKQKPGSKFALGIFAALQTFAVFKIFYDFCSGESRLSKTFEKIRMSGLTCTGQRVSAWLAAASCAVFKLGIPTLLIRRQGEK